MNPVVITLSFDSAEEASAALTAHARFMERTGLIAHADRPDVGVDVSPAPIVVNPFAAGAAVVPVPPSAALSTAVVAVTPTAPVVPPVVMAPERPGLAPLIAVVAAVPSAPVAPTPPVPGVDLDSQGIPWDGRIHGATKTKNADGSWRQKRGLNDESLKLRVEAELKAGQAARAPLAPPAAAVPALPPTTAVLPAALHAPGSAPTETFGQLMARLAPITMGSPAAAGKLNEALAAFGLTALAQLAARPDLVAPFAATVDAMLAVPA